MSDLAKDGIKALASVALIFAAFALPDSCSDRQHKKYRDCMRATKAWNECARLAYPERFEGEAEWKRKVARMRSGARDE